MEGLGCENIIFIYIFVIFLFCFGQLLQNILYLKNTKNIYPFCFICFRVLVLPIKYYRSCQKLAVYFKIIRLQLET